MRARFAAVFGVIAGAAGVLVAAGGCEAIVGGSVGGSIQCQAALGDAADLCPKGQSCIGGTCKPTPVCFGLGCFPREAGFDAPRDAPHDGGVDRDAAPIPDVVPEMVARDVTETSTLLALGVACASGSACQSGTCGSALLLTSNVQTPGGASVCTKPCCTSSDCDDSAVKGVVCYPSVGGDYCVDPMWIGVKTGVGSVLAGNPCTRPGDCRSGVCTGSKCQDTCCLDSNCGNGTVCQYSVLDGAESYNCAPSGGSTSQGGDCSGSACQSNLCVGVLFVGSFCLGACCNDSECQDPSGFGTTMCNWNSLNDKGVLVELRSCSAPLNPDAGAMGSSCGAASDCATNLCYKKTSCTAPCCGNGDCPKGYTCSYASFTFSPDTLDLQVCVPNP